MPRGRPPFADVLTPAEWRVVNAVRHGMTSREIAERRGISIDAVKFHVANALDKLGLPDRAALRRWDGVPRASALATGHPTMTTQPLSAIGQISRTVKDIAAARAWYADVLGLRHLYSFGDLAFFDCDGVRLFLTQGDEPAADSILYFRAPDIHAKCVDLAARGVVITNAPHMIHRHDDGTEEWMAFFKDNESRPLALMTQVQA